MRAHGLSLLLLLLLSPSGQAEPAADEGWEHARTASGVEVHTRVVEGSVFKQFRATAMVDAPIDDVVSWWQDSATFPEWIDSCTGAHEVEAGEGVRASYLEFDFPFPASDRDVVLQAVEIETSPGHVVMESHNLDGVVAEVDGRVRIAMMRGRWEFTALDERSTQVVYSQHMDAGGSLPAFILNRAAIDNPIGTLSGLARFAKAQQAK